MCKLTTGPLSNLNPDLTESQLSKLNSDKTRFPCLSQTSKFNSQCLKLKKTTCVIWTSFYCGQKCLFKGKGCMVLTGFIVETCTTVKPTHAVTSIKQSPVLKGHPFLSCHRKFLMHWSSFERSPVFKDQFFFVLKMTT
jgi:hypothetical protein